MPSTRQSPRRALAAAVTLLALTAARGVRRHRRGLFRHEYTGTLCEHYGLPRPTASTYAGRELVTA
jgi:hypothetical protein